MSDYIHPVEKLIHSTVRIECETKNGPTSGSGYFFAFFINDDDRQVPCIVTNKHVIKGASKGKFALTLKGNDGKPKVGEHITIELDNFESQWICHPDSNIDLAIFLTAPLHNLAIEKNINFYCMQLSKDNIANEQLLNTLPTMEEIIMIGYPNGIWDSKHNLPIIRRGITATHPKLPLNGKPEFMIDAACFPGSSGSPVFLANIGSYINEEGHLYEGSRVALLGTLYAGPQHTATGEIKIIEVPTVTTSIAKTTIPINLGLVIHARTVLDFEPILKDLVDKQKQVNA